MGFYIPPSIRVVKEDVQTSVVLTGGEVVPALIGRSLGKTQNVLGYLAAMGATNVFTFPDLRPNGPVTQVTGVRSAPQGGIRYASGVDYNFDPDAGTITWEDVALAAPFITAIDDVVASSSSLVPGTTYYYVVTALKPTDLTGPVVGETVASNEISSSPITSTSRLKLTWRPVPGATGYKVYRSTIPGNYTGSTLLTTVASGFITSFTDSGGAASAGSPPGVLVFARVVAGGDTPNVIAAGSVFTIDVDTVAHAITLAGTRPSISGTGITYPVTTDSSHDTLVVKVTDKNGSYTSTIVFTHGSLSEATLINQINAFPLVGGSADDNSGQIRLRADAAGSVIAIQIVGGNAMALLGFSATTATGTGDLPDYDHVTTDDIVDSSTVASQLPGATFTKDAGTGRLTVTNNTGGTAHSLQPHTNANTLFGFSTSLVTGNDASAGTALRRPAYHGDSFFVDYQFVSFGYFAPKRFTNLGQGIAEYGLGSTLATGLTLAMGTSGRGNGASQAVTIAVPDDTLQAYQTALDVLMARKDITLVVPLSVADGVANAALQHCIDASSVDHKRERRAVLGTPIGTVVGDEDEVGSAVYRARALDNERAILVHPWGWSNVQGSDGSVVETELDGCFAAAAVAGRIASLSDRATSPTNKQVQGITRLGVTLDETDEDALGGAGVLVLTTEEGNIVIRDGVTTSLDSIEESRIQIGLTDDLLRSTLRAQFKNFRGRKLVPNLLKLVVRRTLRILALFKKLILVTDFDPKSVSAVQDPDVLTNVDARFTYRAIYDVRIVEFRYSLDLSTGVIT
jgi:hypothetical protein